MYTTLKSALPGVLFVKAAGLDEQQHAILNQGDWHVAKTLFCINVQMKQWH